LGTFGHGVMKEVIGAIGAMLEAKFVSRCLVWIGGEAMTYIL